MKCPCYQFLRERMLHCACKAPQCCCLVHLEPPHAGSGSPQDGAPTPAKHQLYYSSIYGQCERVSGQLTVLHYILKLFDHIHVLFMPCKLKHLVLSENQLWIVLGKITELSPDSNIVSAQTQPTSGTRGFRVEPTPCCCLGGFVEFTKMMYDCLRSISKNGFKITSQSVMDLHYFAFQNVAIAYRNLKYWLYKWKKITHCCPEKLPISKIHVHLFLQLINVTLRQNSAIYVSLRNHKIRM